MMDFGLVFLEVVLKVEVVDMILFVLVVVG